MLGKDYDNQVCSIAGALEVVGERWSLLIVRDIFLGVRRFDEIQSDLGIARNVLLVIAGSPKHILLCRHRPGMNRRNCLAARAGDVQFANDQASRDSRGLP